MGSKLAGEFLLLHLKKRRRQKSHASQPYIIMPAKKKASSPTYKGKLPVATLSHLMEAFGSMWGASGEGRVGALQLTLPILPPLPRRSGVLRQPLAVSFPLTPLIFNFTIVGTLTFLDFGG